MLLFWNNGFLRPLIQLGIWLFGNNENEVLTLDNEGERRVDAYGSEGSPFARLAPDLHDGGRTAGLEAGVARRVGRRKERANTGVVTRDDDRCDDEGSCGCGVTYLCSCTLHLILEYWLESAPLPLAVAAAGPRLRLAGEQTGVFYFPGAASCVRATAVLPVATSAAGGSSGGAAAAGSTGVYIAPPLPESSIVLRQHGRCSGGALCSPTTRHVRGTSLMSLSHAMPHSAWWYGRDTPAAHYHCHAVLGTAAATGDGGDAACEAEGRDVTSDGAVDASRRLCACLPLSVEVVAPRIAVPAAAAPTKDAVGATASVPACLWRWLRQPFFALFVGGASCEGREGRAPALSVDAETQRAALQFVALLDQLWCQRRCALVELGLERCPLALAEWMLSPELHSLSNPATALPTAALCGGGRSGGDGSAHEEDVRRAFHHVDTLRCRGRVGPGLAAAAVVANGAALVRPLGFPAVQRHLRVLDLSGSAVASLQGVEAFPLLEKITLTGCTELGSLSPLGLVPSLREIVASQSGIYELDGLARSPALVSLSLYGCLSLVDVSACGRILTLRDLFISESTVEVVEGLRESRSLARLGMRYCDVPLLNALATVSSLRVLHASSSTLTSVAALQYCTSLEFVEVASCAHLVDLGPLGLAPCLAELDASGSAVRHIDGLRHSASLERLFLAQCPYLEDVGHLRECVRLRQLSLTGTLIRSLDGLAGAPALTWLDVSFCCQLVSLYPLLQLPQLQQVMTGGCMAALRSPEEVRSIVASLRARRKAVMVIQA